MEGHSFYQDFIKQTKSHFDSRGTLSNSDCLYSEINCEKINSDAPLNERCHSKCHEKSFDIWGIEFKTALWKCMHVELCLVREIECRK